MLLIGNWECAENVFLLLIYSNTAHLFVIVQMHWPKQLLQRHYTQSLLGFL